MTGQYIKREYDDFMDEEEMCATYGYYDLDTNKPIVRIRTIFENADPYQELGYGAIWAGSNQVSGRVFDCPDNAAIVLEDKLARRGWEQVPDPENEGE